MLTKFISSTHLVNIKCDNLFFFSIKFLNSSPQKEKKKKRNFFWCLWSLFKRTFSDEDNIEELFNLRKEESQKIKSELKLISENDIDKFNSLIPEWKRNGIILVNTQIPNQSFQFKKYLKYFTIHPSKFPLIRKLYRSSDLYLLSKDIKQSYSNIKYNLNFTGNPLLTLPRDLFEKIQIRSPLSKSYEIMRKYDKNFTIEKFEKEIELVFKQFLRISKGNDIVQIKKIASESALAMIKNDIKERKEKKYDYVYKDPIYVETPICQSCEILDTENVLMRLKISTQECIEKKYNTSKGIKIQDKGVIENNQYLIEVMRNPVPFVEDLGHSYIIVNYQKIESYKQLL